MLKLLVTAFDPFGQDVKNPALEAVNLLNSRLQNAEVIKLEIPTVFNQSAEIVAQAIEKEQPDVVIHIGQAGGRFGITPERVAINLDDARIPDNSGQQPIDRAIKADGQAAYFSQLPIKAMVDALKAHNIPASVSNSAGTFVCNHIMYQTLYLCHKQYPHIKSGFIHVPYLPEQTLNKLAPSMSLAMIVKGLEIALETIVSYHNQEDDKIVGGSLH